MFKLEYDITFELLINLACENGLNLISTDYGRIWDYFIR